MNSSIVGGTANIVTSDDVLELAFTKAQSLTLQSRSFDTFMSFSREGLKHKSSRFKLSRFFANDGTGESGLVLTFPIKSFTGSLFFASANPAQSSIVTVWQICENSYY